MSSSNKREHKTLTLIAKTEEIKKLEKGYKFINLAEECSGGRTTIYDIKKNREIKINVFRLFLVILRFQ
jgi:hypothetical protein